MKIPKGYKKTIENYLYVNKNGQFFSTNNHFNSKKIPTIYKDKDGYSRIWVNRKNGSRKFISVHRLVLSTFKKMPINKTHVNHLNGIRNDNKLENLEWVSIKENNRYSRRVLKNIPVGEKASRSKLKEYQVVEIIKKYLSGIDQKTLMIEYKVSISQIIRICNGKNWGHVWKKYNLSK